MVTLHYGEGSSEETGVPGESLSYQVLGTVATPQSTWSIPQDISTQPCDPPYTDDSEQLPLCYQAHLFLPRVLSLSNHNLYKKSRSVALGNWRKKCTMTYVEESMLGTSKSAKWVTAGSTLGIPSADDVFFPSKSGDVCYLCLSFSRTFMHEYTVKCIKNGWVVHQAGLLDANM